MALKRIDTESGAEKKAREVFDNLNQSKSGKQNSRMVQYSIKLYPEERIELQNVFSSLGLTFSSGIRFALAEFKRNHSKDIQAI